MIDLLLANPILPAMLLMATVIALKEISTGRGTSRPLRRYRKFALWGWATNSLPQVTGNDRRNRSVV